MNELTTEREKHQYCKETLEYKTDIEWRFVGLGERLYKIKQERMFEAGWSSWEEFEMELKMSPATVSKLLRIYEIFILKYSFTPKQIAETGGWSVVAELLPSIGENATKARIKELFAVATSQSRSDLRKTLLEAKTGIDMTKCKHMDSYTIKICRTCGDRELIEDSRNL
jgi:hypothetical protein